ncbi:molecular chaperone [Clostridia bacterium]|nr:molecular chaperone [Clostridia bacterium]
MAIEIFNRYENKYLIPITIYEKLQSRLSDYMEADAFNKNGKTYTICNIYYDTADSHLIRTSLQKPAYKEKLRLRSYGMAETDTKVFVEIKKKVRGLVNKRRSGMTYAVAEEFLRTEVSPAITEDMNEQVLHEVSYLLSHKHLQPRLYLAYERMAWFGTGAHDVRVSFDSKIVSRRSHLSLTAAIEGNALLPADVRLMEIKVARSIPLWLSRLLSEYRIYPTSFSKYGREYQKQLVYQSNERDLSSALTGTIEQTLANNPAATTPNYEGEYKYA